jgi:hypothetical protein
MEKIEYRDRNFNLDLYLGFLTPEEAKSVFETIEVDTEWTQPRCGWKRRNVTYGDGGLTYAVNFPGGKTAKRVAAEWPSYIIPIKEQVEDLINQKCNICVLQEYPSGKVGIKPHRDKEMTPGTTIAGVSIGEERILVMGTWSNPDAYSIPLPSGSLYVLNPPTNDGWSHSIKRDGSTGVRYSLTFRNYVK